jgi:epidermal growth factor receptor kinase substrate 8
VREPTAFTSSDPKEMYNNILIYVVGHPPTESPIPAEMHIFQESIF